MNRLFIVSIRRTILSLLMGITTVSCCFFASAQSTYDLQFTNPQANCVAGEYCVTVQVKAAEGAADFVIGAHTVYFSYSPNSINNPSYFDINFNDDNLCIDGLLSPYATPAFSSAPDEQTGEANFTTLMNIPNQGCPTIAGDWIDMGTVCFNIVDAGLPVNLGFDFGLTVLNINANQGPPNPPIHFQGTLADFSAMIDCTGSLDDDMDGLSNSEEEALGTNPNLADSDMDGINDGGEVALGTNPLDADSDDDMVNDGLEVSLNGNPLVPDTDMDGLLDNQEVELGTALDNSDTDNDLLSDADEVNVYQTNPLLADSDEDNLSDFDEINIYNSEPNNPDTDNDQLNDGDEVAIGTSLFEPDTDMDGLSDGLEFNELDTEPLVPDSDDDGLEDGEEIELGTNPLNGDSDFDNLGDGAEVNIGTNPLLEDSDMDGLLDGEEIDTYDTNPLLADSDMDGLNDLDELNLGSSPLNPDMDGDGVLDGEEAAFGDSDGDETPNVFDPDDDNDSILTFNEVAPGSTDPTTLDTDGDEIPNYLDPDDDNDMIDTIDEGDTDDNDNDIPDYLEIDIIGAISDGNVNNLVQVFPNPVRSTLTISLETTAFNASQGGTLQVFNGQGQMIYTLSELQKSTQQIDVQAWQKGIYWLQWQQEESRVVKPFVVW
ncbi:MAG: T9SS type A sorting domain-containing protein [Chitinophagales bacterium]